ncbi:MAG: hypothetical protein AAF221_01630 [Pseudomonadota bacterium]
MSLELELEDWLTAAETQSDVPNLFFVSGAQGIGKSTALNAIAAKANGKILTLGLDDFYLTLADRDRLAKDVHPHFKIRGAPFKEWRQITTRPEIIVLEGWLMGVAPNTQSLQDEPLNAIERADCDGIWRRYQETQLSTSYTALWDRADAFCHIDAPGFSAVLKWRLEQERFNCGQPDKPLTPERIKWVEEFILFYERLTKRMLNNERRPGCTIHVDVNRRVLR